VTNLPCPTVLVALPSGRGSDRAGPDDAGQIQLNTRIGAADGAPQITPGRRHNFACQQIAEHDAPSLQQFDRRTRRRASTVSAFCAWRTSAQRPAACLGRRKRLNETQSNLQQFAHQQKWGLTGLLIHVDPPTLQ
jgi:hypothetical protein